MMLNMYKKQFRKYPDILSIRSILNLSSYRGNMVNVDYAEAFEIIRKVKY